jgi:hypothetical protein
MEPKKLIAVFTKARHWSVPWGRWTQDRPSWYYTPSPAYVFQYVFWWTKKWIRTAVCVLHAPRISLPIVSNGFKLWNAHVMRTSRLDLRQNYAVHVKRLRKITKDLSEDSSFLGRNSKWELLEYQLTRSVAMPSMSLMWLYQHSSLFSSWPERIFMYT